MNIFWGTRKPIPVWSSNSNAIIAFFVPVLEIVISKNEERENQHFLDHSLRLPDLSPMFTLSDVLSTVCSISKSVKMS